VKCSTKIEVKFDKLNVGRSNKFFSERKHFYSYYYCYHYHNYKWWWLWYDQK